MLLTPTPGDLSVATAVILRYVPLALDRIPYSRKGHTVRGLIKALNDRLPPVTTTLVSVGRAALTPALLGLTRELGVAWWSEGSMLFTWVHEGLRLRLRPHLAESAKRIHALLSRTG